jgi:hypothetical protein
MSRKVAKTVAGKPKPETTAMVVNMALKEPLPPKFGEWLLYLMPRQERLEFYRDLMSDYKEAARKFGPFGADLNFYLQISIRFWTRIRRSVVSAAAITAGIKLLLWIVSLMARNT